MIKRIIFDLDNTLIMWKDEYLSAIKETVELYKIKDDYKYISTLIDEYDNRYSYYDKDLLVEFINKNINDKIDTNFIDTFLNKIGYCSDIDYDVINTLKYLSNKYELVVLTNWFTVPQINRLKHAKIDKYFKYVIGGEEVIKPNKKAFLKACYPYEADECIMVGDDYIKDIKGAYDSGLNVIYFNYKKKENKDNFKEINKFIELERIL